MNDPKDWRSNVDKLSNDELSQLLLTLDGIGLKKKKVILTELIKRNRIEIAKGYEE